MKEEREGEGEGEGEGNGSKAAEQIAEEEKRGEEEGQKERGEVEEGEARDGGTTGVGGAAVEAEESATAADVAGNREAGGKGVGVQLDAAPPTGSVKDTGKEETVAADSRAKKKGGKKKKYLVKWRNKSYIHCSWVPAVDLEEAARDLPGLKQRLRNFHQKKDARLAARGYVDEEDEEAGPALNPDWLVVDRVIHHK